ncbi:MAG: NADH-quinone oxidoreductase subunit A [Elusimicrobia bacterium]|nr:NADH-quinone oxidoreductase subunit A [Elusimicrobiota bacterium]
MNYGIFIIPPLAFLVCLAAVWLFSKVAALLAHKKIAVEGKDEPYACGENITAEKAEPDYRGFFPFAIFFTVLHVAGLMLAMWANVSVASYYAGIAYLTFVALALAMIFTD